MVGLRWPRMAVDPITPVVPVLPPVAEQVARLRSLGMEVPDLPDRDDALVALAPGTAPVATLAGHLTRRGKPGFVVEDMTDVDEFVPPVDLPPGSAYLVTGLDRGDDLLGWRPPEALAELARRDRTPLTLQEGISWLLQVPEVLEDNRCFMTIGSRKPKARGGYDARTPALWISGGTGRDGVEHRHAPKVGWCWWNNHHTWLGFASCVERISS